MSTVQENAPIFDRDRNFGTITHGDLQGKDPSELPRFEQDGHYFAPTRRYLGETGVPKRRPAPAPADPLSINTLPAVPADEVEQILQDPRAEVLLDMPRDAIIAAVNKLNGPMIAGEGSTRAMCAFILKHTSKKLKPAAPKAAAAAESTATPDDEL